MEKQIYEIAIRFFEGTIAPDEEQMLFHFLTENPQHLVKFKKWEQQWKQEHIAPLDVLNFLELLKTKIRERRHPMRRFWIRISAAAAVLILLSTFAVRFFTADEHEQIFRIEAPQGTHSRISLPDGTQVWLNAGSNLSYNSNFNTTSRDIELSGEAYFEVAHNAALPFRIKAQNCTFTVLGTKFNISAYDEDPAVLAALIEGSLRFESLRDTETMIPGDLVTYDRSTMSVERKQVDVRQYRAWIDGIIRYDAVTLPALLRRLAREYDVEIDLRTREFDDTTFRIALSSTQNINSVLRALCDILPITVNCVGCHYVVDSAPEHP